MKRFYWLAFLLPIFITGCPLGGGGGGSSSGGPVVNDPPVTAATCILGTSTIGNCEL